MFLNLTLLLLAGVPSSPQPQHPPVVHFKNYHRAHQMARKSEKPLLMILNDGSTSASETISFEQIQKNREHLALLKKYVVVTIDVTTRHGKIVHKAYNFPKLPHVVVLDKQQRYLVFAASGQFRQPRWTEILRTYHQGRRKPVVDYRSNYIAQTAGCVT